MRQEHEERTDGDKPLMQARLGAMSPLVIKHMLTPRLARDLRFLPEHLNIDLAHTVMLVEQDILDRRSGAALLACLREAADNGPERFPVDPEYDSMVLQVEHYLSKHLGADVAGRMHVGRSRIDHNAAVQRLAARNRLLDVHVKLTELAAAIRELAGRHANTVMPGWTHLQHAQPWTLGHYLLRQLYVLLRNLDRITQAYPRVDLSSLGGAALVGTSWPLDRQRVAELLGHSGIVANAHDAGEFTLDWVNEYAAVLSMVMVELGRIAGDLYLWSSWEFHLVELDDSLCGTSSIMPQKKNAVVLEHIRAHAGKSIGWFTASAGIARSASSTDVDPAYGGSVIEEAADTTSSCADIMIGVLQTLTVDEAEMRERAGAHWSTASSLADELARETGLPFRTTHHVVARLVRDAIDAGVTPTEVTGELLDEAAVHTTGEPLGLSTAWVAEQLDPVRFLASRVTAGSASPEQVARQLRDCDAQISQHMAWATARRDHVDASRRQLAGRIDELVGESR